MTPSGRCCQLVKAKGALGLVQISQYCGPGRTVILIFTPICFHIGDIACAAIGSHAVSDLQINSPSKPSGLPASASSFLAPAISCFMKPTSAYSGCTLQT